LRRQLKKKPAEQNNFKSFIKNSSKILLIIPEDRECWNFLKPIFTFLKEAGKEISIFLPESMLESFALRRKIKPITFTKKEISKLNLPARSLEEKLKDKSFDVIIDLNIEENLFYSAVANIFNSEFRIGFIKNDSDLYYNFQIPQEINNEFSYRNLLNSLSMF
jgi:ADP-heptose:LPS heptosyltransferase